MSGWSIDIACDGRITLAHSNGSKLTGLLPSVTVAGQCHQPDSLWSYDIWEGGVTYTLPGVMTLKTSIDIICEEWLSIDTTVANTSADPLPLDTVTVLSGQFQAPVRWVLQNGNDMCGDNALVAIRDTNYSRSMIGFTDAEGDCAMVLGFVELGEAFNELTTKGVDGQLSAITCSVLREGVALEPSESLTVSPLTIGAGESLRGLLAEYTEAVAEGMGARIPDDIMTGWCSWYYYYGTECETEVMENAKLLSEAPFADELKVIQIDDGWTYPSPEIGRDWGDWQAGYKFPNGMKHTADALKSLGLQPGLWLAPFSVMPTSNFYKEHPDWLVQDPVKDEPIMAWGCYGMDLTNPRTLEYIRDTFVRVFDEWGFEYIKIDFLVHGIMPGRRYDPSQTTAQAFRTAMQVIRDVAGDRFILNCGSPMGPSVGIADAMRIGYDVSSRWSIPMNVDGWPNGNCAVKPAAVATIWRHWMHNAWWQNDPDCLQVRTHGSPGEIAVFAKEWEGKFDGNPPYGLNDEEAGCWLRMIWFTGGLVMLSEHLADLEPERYELLQKLFPLNKRPTGWADYYPCPDVVVMKSLDDDNVMVGVFNMGDTPVQLTVPADKLGLSDEWHLTEWLDNEEIAGSGAQVVFPELPAHGGRIWFAG